jgi:hypothetical protein
MEEKLVRAQKEQFCDLHYLLNNIPPDFHRVGQTFNEDGLTDHTLTVMDRTLPIML